MRKLLLAVIATFTALVGNANAASFLYNGRSVIMSGELVPGDGDRLQAAIDHVVDREGRVERIVLNSPGGDVHTGVLIARMIYAYSIDTVVGRTDECASMCTLVFAAGGSRFVYPTSRIGVHSASIESANGASPEIHNSMATTVHLARLMAEIGVPGSVIVKMLTTENADMRWLDYRDLGEWVILLD